MLSNENSAAREAFDLGSRNEGLPEGEYSGIVLAAHGLGRALLDREKYGQVWNEAVSKTSGINQQAFRVLQNAANLLGGDTELLKHTLNDDDPDILRVDWWREFAFTEAASQNNTSATPLQTPDDRPPTIRITIEGKPQLIPVDEVDVLCSAPLEAVVDPEDERFGQLGSGTTHIFINSGLRSDIIPGGESTREYRQQNGIKTPNTDDSLDGSLYFEIDTSGQIAKVDFGRNNSSKLVAEPIQGVEVDAAGFLTQLNSAIFETSQRNPNPPGL